MSVTLPYAVQVKDPDGGWWCNFGHYLDRDKAIAAAECWNGNVGALTRVLDKTKNKVIKTFDGEAHIRKFRQKHAAS